MLNFHKSLLSKQFFNIAQKGYKMTQLHFYNGNPGTTSGFKVCIFGATSNMGPNIAGHLVTKGTPTIMVHRNALDVISPLGNDLTLIKSNPYRSWSEMRSWADIGMRYFQLVHDLTNPYDVEIAIKDCDVVINLIGQKPVNRKDEYYEEPNILIPREIAKACAKKKDNNVKRFIHFSACGAGPDAISTRLRTKWQGEQEVLKYYPEATIMRPTTIMSNSNQNNFVGHYLHSWSNNNGTIFLLDEGKVKRAPVTDHDVALAVVNALQLENTKGQIFELGSNNSYNVKELYEYFSNCMNHRPKYVSYQFEEFMKLHLGPNSNFEKSINWLISRPDYLSELRQDIVAVKRDGVKTFEDLYITPTSPHHFILDLSNWMIEKLVLEKETVRDHDEHDANWEGHPN